MKEPSGIGNNNLNTIENLFNKYYPSLCAFAQSYINDCGSSEDIVQDVFITLWNKYEELDQIQSVKSYLYTSVRNACLNHLKHDNIVGKFAEAELSEKESDIFFNDHVIEEETHRFFYKAIQELPEKCREIILLSLDGLKNTEISEELNVSINTIKTQKRIAYTYLRMRLKDILAVSPLIIPYFFSK